MSRILPAVKRVLRVPSFRVAYAVSLLPPLALLGWAFVDAHFWNTVHNSWLIVGIGQRDTTFSMVWKNCGDLLVMGSLITVGAVAAVIVAIRLFIGTKGDRSLLSWLLATVLVGVWAGALLGVVRYPNAQVRYRLRRDLWRFQTVATAITAAGRIPRSAKTKIGEIQCETVDTDRWPSYFLPQSRRSIHEDVAGIWTLDDGALLFTVYPGRVALEFHPHGTQPHPRYSKPKYGLEGIIVPCLEELGDGWFLVKCHK